MARHTGGDLLLGLVLAGVAGYLWLQFRTVNHSVDVSSAGSGPGPQCMDASLPDLNLGGVVIPGEKRTVCLG